MPRPRLSLAARLINVMLRIMRRLGVTRTFDDLGAHPDKLDEIVAKGRRGDQREPHRAVLKGRHHEVLDIDGDVMHLLSGPAPGARVILYLHGGGYLIGPSRLHWAALADVSTQTGADMAMHLYPRTPEVDHEQIIESAYAAYTTLVDRYGAHRIVVAGDSAGGGLTATLLLLLRERGGPQPHAAVLISPWLDLALSDPAALAQESTDLMLTVSGIRNVGLLYAGSRRTDDPLISPVYASLENLAPMHLFVGTEELFLADCRTFAKRAAVDGATATLREMPGGQHVAAIFPTPEGRAARAQMAALVDWP